MATVTVSANANLATLSYSAGDDIVITGPTTLTCNSDPSALPAIRSIRSSDARSSFVYRNTNTAFSAGSLWKLPFENGGSVVGAGGTLAFSNGATCDIQGEMLTCYTATGAASETVLDASNVLGVDVDFPYFIECETCNGTGVYKPIPVVVVGGPGDGYISTSLTTRFGVGDVGRVLFYDRSTRLLRTGDGTNGTLIAAGVRFRIPNTLVWLPAFTLTVGAAGWTAATGAQPVVSSTNAPLHFSTSQPAYLIGSEIVNINSLPSGTSVNVAARALDTTTAATYAAGTVAYCVPNRLLNMAGKSLANTGGNYILARCFFSRWWCPFFQAFGEVSADEAGMVVPFGGLDVFQSAGSFAYENGVLVCTPVVTRQNALNLNTVQGDLSISGTSILGTVSTTGTAGYGNNAFFSCVTTLSINGLEDVRMWRMGCPAGVGFTSVGLIAFGSSSFKSSGINGLEIVNLGSNFNDVAMQYCSGLRYSSTSGIANTTTLDIAFSLGTSGKLIGTIVNDFDVISGGHAPYDAWFTVHTNAENLIIHNKVSGAVRTVDCQSRTRYPVSLYNGKGHIFANATFSNIRAAGQTQFNAGQGAASTIRNVRWSDLAGAAADSASIQPLRGAVFDFPGGPVNALAAGIMGLVSNQPDVQAIYACPNTWPGLAGGLYIGPVTAKQALDLYTFTGGAYQNNNGALFIETSGDTAIIKATSPVTGIASVTGTAPVFYGNNASTGLTYEFRLCNWGDDITALGWTALTGANVQTAFNALTGYSAYVGLDFQLKITATTTSVNRVLLQCWIPVQMDTAYNPPVATVEVTVVGAAASATTALYNALGARVDLKTTDGSGNAVLSAPYDFDDVPVNGTLKIRALEFESIDAPITWTGAATVPATMPALTGYTAGADTGATFDKGTKTVTVTADMSTQDLWSRWRRYIVQLVNFDAADSWSYPALDLGDWNIVVDAADLTGNLTTTGDASQVSGGRFLGVVQAANGSSGVLTVTGLTAAQVYVENDSQVQQDYQPSQTGTYTYPTPFGATGTWRMVVNKEGYFPQTFDFSPGQSNEFAVTLQELRNPDGTLLYQGGSYPEIACTFVTAGNMRVRFGVEVTLQKIVDATQQAYSTSAGMAWLARDNAELTAAILSAGQFIFLPERTRLFGTQLNAALAAFAVSADAVVVDAATDYPIRYVQPPSVAGSAEEVATAVLAAAIHPEYDLARTLRIIAAAVAGKTTGGPSGFVARDLADTADQITGAADADGNRTSASYGP